MKKRLSALAVIWLLLWNCLAFADFHQVKPTIWACDPGTVAYNCARMGLPMPDFAAPFWGPGGKLYEYSGNRSNGTINGATWAGQGLDFDGLNDYVDCDLPAIFDDIPNNDFTIAIRMSSDDLSNQDPWLRLFDARKNGENFVQIHTYETNNLIAFTVEDANTARCVRTNVELSVGTVYDLVGAWNAGANDLKLYVDGIPYTTAGSVGYPGTQEKLVIGARSNLAAYWDGPIFYFYIFPACFTSNQVQILRSNPYGMFEPIKWPIWSYSGAAPPTTVPQTIMMGW